MTKLINQGVEQAIKIAGSQGKLAVKIGYGQSTVWKWLHGEQRVPAEAISEIVELTGGQVKPSDLRPDLPKLFPPPS